MITLDGSMGEGGGQLLRSALALSLVTGEPFVMRQIRAGRKKPGLMRQHLTCVVAAQAVGQAEVQGAEIGSQELSFTPRALRGGEFHFAVGTAGSSMLVLQTVLAPLLRADTASSLVLEGGTHNPSSPPFDFIARVFVPALARMGVRVELRLERHGFYPAGGGRVRATISPATQLAPLVLLERGPEVVRSATALVSELPHHVGLRELDVLCARLGWDRSLGRVETVRDAQGPGNALWAEVAFEECAELVTSFGDRRLSGSQVAQSVCQQMQRFLATNVPVGEHLADQLLLPMALGQGGRFRTLDLSSHATTQIALLRLFMGTQVRVQQEGPDVCLVEVHVPNGNAPSKQVSP